jgi:AraC-like DNA-binding protein
MPAAELSVPLAALRGPCPGSPPLSRRARPVGVGRVRSDTVASRRRLYLLARVVVSRHYRRRLTLPIVAGAVASSPRQLQRAYEQFGQLSFHEDLLARRMAAAATLLIEQPAIAVADVARLVGYRQPSHFARAFRRRDGLAPAGFREVARQNARHRHAATPSPGSRQRG